MVAFAKPDDVAGTLKRTFSSDEDDWVKLLLEQSADYLRYSVIGQHVYPPTTVTFTAYPVGGRVTLPQSYVQEIVSVKAGDDDVAYTRFEDVIEGVWEQAVDVTFTYGAVSPPADLAGVNIAMVSSAISLVESGLGVSFGGLSSLALDDFKVAFADGGDKTGHLTLPALTADNLRRAYGADSGTAEHR
ncbi:hypothetical protein [Microbacterium jejuense]|uniref:hypothetical protein n=1 Tax=Microbacterium jejuense TaxID=1263637 RepID=UPI0031E6FE47